MMQKFWSIYFIFIFMCANTAFGEVLKLPVLFEHYTEHAQKDKDVSFFDFLAKHYGTSINHQHNDKHHDHENLPFKTTNVHFVHVVSLEPPFLFMANTILGYFTNEVIIHHQQAYSNTTINTIWQPPRLS